MAIASEAAMIVAITDEYAVRLRVEYPDVTRFLTAYWPTPETDDATALHAMLSTACAADVSWWRRQLLLFLLSSADDADKAAFVRMSARRRFQTERPEEALTWPGRWPWRCWILRTISHGSSPEGMARRDRASKERMS